MDATEFTAARKAIGWSMRRIAAELDVDVGTVSRWESGERPISRTTELALETIKKARAMIILTDPYASSARPCAAAEHAYVPAHIEGECGRLTGVAEDSERADCSVCGLDWEHNSHGGCAWRQSDGTRGDCGVPLISVHRGGQIVEVRYE